MRISDWSSDVCSSDLLLKDMLGGSPRMRTICRKSGTRLTASIRLLIATGSSIKSGVMTNTVRTPLRDRKCGVSGKSVAVRVDLGGRRIVKKKTKQTKGNIQDKSTYNKQ